MLNNNLGLACVFLDPRFQILLTSSQKTSAMRHLTYLHNRISTAPSESIDNAKESSVEYDGDDDESLFEKLLQKRERDRHIEAQECPLSEVSEFPRFIEAFNNIMRVILPENQNIFDYWNNNQKHPQLAELAKIVLAVPATQVSVERAFSTFGHVFGQFRGTVKPYILESQMLVALNKMF